MDEPSKSRALLLDLDGTIADTLPHVFDAYRHAVAPWVERPPTDAEIEATFGPSERECIALMAPGADLDEAVERFHAYHEAHHGRAVKVVEGIAEVIDLARGLGWRVGVFTGKGRRPAEFSLVELGLWDRIEHLVSGTDVARPKPDPEGVFQASEALGVPVGPHPAGGRLPRRRPGGPRRRREDRRRPLGGVPARAAPRGRRRFRLRTGRRPRSGHPRPGPGMTRAGPTWCRGSPSSFGPSILVHPTHPPRDGSAALDASERGPLD